MDPKDRPYKCDRCDKAYARKDNLEAHIQWHTGTKKYKCDMCKKSYRLLRHLNVHKKNHFAPMLQCKECSFKCKDPYYMKKHVKTIHRGVKCWKCKVCDEKFFLKKERTDHMKEVHYNGTLPKPFACHLCGKSYTRKTILNDHLKVHSAEKPFIRNHCGKGFTRSCLLQVHEKIHTNLRAFKCETCGDTFNTKGGLTTHSAVHKKDRQLTKCEVCDKEFTTNGSLTRHMRSHTGEQPYKCHCGAAFNQTCSLIRHRQQVHQDYKYKCQSCKKGFILKKDMLKHEETCQSSDPDDPEDE